jgi:hypothetical protein
MHNGFHHYLKLGMYRHPEIATENRLDIRDVFIEHLKDWPEAEKAPQEKPALQQDSKR